MLAELAAANAAFAVIKQAVSNGKEIAAAGNAIAEFVGAKEKLEKKASKKGNGADLEEWQKFQAKARVARREAENAAVRRRKKITEGTIIAVLILAIVGVLAALVVLILHAQGRL